MTLLNKDRLTNTLGTTEKSYSIDKMNIEYVETGPDAGAKLTFPNLPPIILRARNTKLATKWYNGESDPSLDIGNENDYYLKYNGELFYRTIDSWELVSNLTGPVGPAGPQGEQGIQGVPGPDGPSASINSASDAVITSPENYHILSYDSLTNKWVNIDPANNFGLFAVDKINNQLVRGYKTFEDGIDAKVAHVDKPLENDSSRRIPTTSWVKDITGTLNSASYMVLNASASLPNSRLLRHSDDFYVLDGGIGAEYTIGLVDRNIAGTYSKVTVNTRGIVTNGQNLSNSDFPNSGVAAGVYNTVTVNAKGIVTFGENVDGGGTAELPNIITPITLSGVSVNAKGLVTEIVPLINSDLPQSGISAGTYTKLIINEKGVATGSANFVNADLPNSVLPAGTYDIITTNSKGIAIAGEAAPIVTPGTYTKVVVSSSGRVTSGAGLVASDLPISGVVSATYSGLSIDQYGRVVSAASLDNSDLPDSGVTASTVSGVTVNDKGIITQLQVLSNTDLPNSGVIPETYTKVVVNAKGVVTSGSALLDVDIPSSIARLSSPTFTGIPLAPTPATSINNTQIATTAYVKAVVNELVDGAGEALNTLAELSAALGDDPNFATTITTELDKKLVKDQNLNDLPDKVQARINIGLQIGTNVQAYNALLQSFSGLNTVAGRAFYTTANNTVSTFVISSTGIDLLSGTPANARTVLQLGNAATKNESDLTLGGATISGNNTTILVRNTGTAGILPSLATLNFGELFLNYNDGRLYYKGSSNTVETLNLKGPKGDKGDKGDIGETGLTGPQGLQGVQGPQGLQGLQGNAGPQGADGPVGPKGDIGETGLTGPQGLQGLQGPAGVKGDKGDKGDIGDIGETGPAGIQGPAGEQGIPGIAGPAGPAGSKGDIGETGLAGPQGADGPQGIQGETGPQGIQGITGVAGPTGPQGIQGPQGLKGDQGAAAGIFAFQGERTVPTNTNVTGATSFNFGPVQYQTCDGVQISVLHTGLSSSVRLAVGPTSLTAQELGTFSGDGQNQWRTFFAPVEFLNQTQNNHVYVWSTSASGGDLLHVIVTTISKNTKVVPTSRRILSGTGINVPTGDGSLTQDIRVDFAPVGLQDVAMTSQDFILFSDESTGGTPRKRSVENFINDVNLSSGGGNESGGDADTLSGLSAHQFVRRDVSTLISASHTYLNNNELRFGDNNDLLIYHPENDANSYFINQSTDGNLLFKTMNLSDELKTNIDIGLNEITLFSNGIEKFRVHNGGATIYGNLTITGETTVINSTEVDILDNIIVLNSGEEGVPTQNAGIEIERGTSSNVQWLWNEVEDYWSPMNQRIGGVLDPSNADHIGDRGYNDNRYILRSASGGEIEATKTLSNNIKLQFSSIGLFENASIVKNSLNDFVISNEGGDTIIELLSGDFNITDGISSILSLDRANSTLYVDNSEVLTAASNDINANTLNGIASSDFARLSQSNTFASNIRSLGTDNKIIIQRTASGYETLTSAMSGMELIARGMNDLTKYTPAIKFMSDDTSFTTETPKLLAAIVGAASQPYSEDNRSGMGLEFFVSPNTGGISNTIQLALTIKENRVSNFAVRPTVNDVNILLQSDTGSGNGLDADTVDGIQGVNIITDARLTNYSLNPRFETSIGFGSDNATALEYINTQTITRTGYWTNLNAFDIKGFNNALVNIVTRTGHLDVTNVWVNGKIGINGQILASNGTAAAPSQSFTNAPSSGLFSNVSTGFKLAANGSDIATVSTNGIEISNTKGAALRATTTTVTNPSILVNKADIDTGFGQGNVDTISIVVGGTELARFDSQGLSINGSLTATQKSFVIDHPTQQNKKLRYGSLEGPENGVYVRGRSKSTIIELPDYWVKLVDEDTITVSITPIGNHQKLFVEKIEDNRVYISSENFIKKFDFFYHIFAERKDISKLQTVC